MEVESVLKFEIHYKNKRFDTYQNNCFELQQIIDYIKNELKFQDEKDIHIYHIDENQKIIKQILNSEDLHSCKKKTSEDSYFIKLFINIDPESHKYKDMFLYKNNTNLQ